MPTPGDLLCLVPGWILKQSTGGPEQDTLWKLSRLFQSESFIIIALLRVKLPLKNW